MRRKRTLQLLSILTAGACLAACNKPLFPADQPRTQFERFDQVRNQSTPEYIDDEFGRRRPNVQARIEPK